MTKSTVLFCTGLSGSGKTYFIEHKLPAGTFHNLKSATTRQPRDTDPNATKYYYRDEKYFESEKFATYLDVNRKIRKPGDPKWLYGVPEFEIWENWGNIFTYDVIEPKYVRQMIEWFNKNDITHKYNFRIAWFIPMIDNAEIVKQRQNMPNDLLVRQINTCNRSDFERAGLKVDHVVVSNQYQYAIDDRLQEFIDSMKTYTR